MTDISDYLIAILQKLEPFEPEDDARYATNRSLWKFCNVTTAMTSAGVRSATNEDDMKQNEGELRMSSADMWTSAIANKKIDVCVEKSFSV